MKRVDQLFSSLKSFFTRTQALLSVVLSIAFVLSACNNIGTSAINGTSANGTSPNDTNLGTAAGNFSITQLVPDADDPNTTIDVIGTGSQFDTFCTQGTCMCEYTYTSSGGGTQTTSVANTYQESNMIRCPNEVPSGITNFSFRITVVASTTTTSTTGTPAPTPVGSPGSIIYASNSITDNFVSGALAGTSSYMDLTNAASYIQVQRFQCRQRVFIPNPMNPNMIDPFQSQNPEIIYPFNYYTTNLASSLLNQQTSSNTAWECTLTANQNHTVQWWANPNVFSRATCTTSFCAGDGDLIYPQTSLTSGPIPVTDPTQTGKRRSSFALASKSSGVFSIAVQAAISPISYVTSNYATIGYAAAPIATSGGTSACPNIQLPSNATWVKLWNFRVTDIAASQMVTGSQSITNSAIACDTSHSDGGTNGQNTIIPSCEVTDWANPAPTPFGQPLLASEGFTGVTDPTMLASRIALFNSSAGVSQNASACYNFSPANNPASIPWHFEDTAGGRNPASYAGADVWIPSPYKLDNTVAESSFTGYPWNEYANVVTLYPTPAQSTAQTEPGVGSGPFDQWFASGGNLANVAPLASATPVDFQNVIQHTTISSDVAYTDQIFVVTDPAVSDSDMLAGALDIQQYFPRTFRQASDCPGPSSCNPVTTGKTETNWGLYTKAVGATDDTPDVYPLCVIQFYD